MDKNETQIFCDGGARGNPGPAAAAFVVEVKGKIIYKDAKFLGKATNNVAEYRALVMALSWIAENLKEISGTEIFIILDSELVAKQMSGQFRLKNENLKPLFLEAKNLEKRIGRPAKYLSVSRDKNKLADFLVNKYLNEASRR